MLGSNPCPECGVDPQEERYAGQDSIAAEHDAEMDDLQARLSLANKRIDGLRLAIGLEIRHEKDADELVERLRGALTRDDELAKGDTHDHD